MSDQETRKLKPKLSSFLPLYRCISKYVCHLEHQAERRCLPVTCTCFMEIISTPYINAVSTILDTCTLDVLWGQRIKLIQVASNSELHQN
jgi:hypothetical protein